MPLAFRADTATPALTSVLPRLRRSKGRPWIEPFGALVGKDAVHVHGRLHCGVQPREAPQGLVERAQTLWHRWETDEVAGATVHARVGAASTSGVTDAEGYFMLQVPLAPSDRQTTAIAPYTPVELTADGATCDVQASTPGRDARFVVISDVDDTALVAHATNRVRQAVTLYLREAAERKPVEGMARLYRALCLGGGDAPQHNPVAYVSSCPANLVAVVRRALAQNGFPGGPMFLPDIGIDEHKFIKLDHMEHKATCITRLLDAWGDLPALLFGDTGQADPEVFEHVAAKHPGRVRGVFLRDAPGGDARRADEVLGRLRLLGVRTARAGRSEGLQRELASAGWVASFSAP